MYCKTTTIILALGVAFLQTVTAFECSNLKHSWRLKADLNLDWDTAKTAFDTAFSSPFNDNFPVKVVSGLQTFTPLSDSSYVIRFTKNGIHNVTETVTNYSAGQTCASANAHIEAPGMGIIQDVQWIHAIDNCPDGIVSYYFGFVSCVATTSEGEPLSTRMVSTVCNEQNINTFILTSVKRRACILENYNKHDAVEICENLEAAKL